MNHENMKMTEVGWIPKDWECNLFEDVLSTFTTGSTPYRGIPEYYQGNEKWVSSGELNYNIISDTHEHITREAIRDSNLKVHEVGTFLMAITGLEAEGTRGKCAILGVPATTNQSCLAINSTDRMTTDYLFHYYQHFSNWYAFKYSQGTKQQSYKAEIVKKFPIIHPAKLSEQRRIAQVLSDTDSLIASLSRTIEKKRLVKQGAMQQLLTGKTRLKGFSGEWVEKELGEIGKTIRGVGFTPEQSSLTPSSNSIPLLRSNNIQKQTIVLNDLIYVDKSCIANRQIMNYGDILICAANGSRNLVGKSSMYKSAFQRTFGAFMCVFRCFDKFQSAFVSYLFQSDCYKEQLDEILTGSAINNLNGSQIEALRFFVPQSVDEQQAIANILTTMDNEIASLEAELQKYKALKQGMMQKLLTGQIRLK